MLWAWVMFKGDLHGRFGGNFRHLDVPLNFSLSDAFCNWWTTSHSLSQVILDTAGKDCHIPGSTVSRKVICPMQPFTHSLTGLSVTFQHPEQETNNSSLFSQQQPHGGCCSLRVRRRAQRQGQGWNSHWAEALLEMPYKSLTISSTSVEKVVCLF